MGQGAAAFARAAGPACGRVRQPRRDNLSVAPGCNGRSRTSLVCARSERSSSGVTDEWVMSPLSMTNMFSSSSAAARREAAVAEAAQAMTQEQAVVSAGTGGYNRVGGVSRASGRRGEAALPWQAPNARAERGT